MKPVCECKYERRIVKRNEERKKWHDRQERLKSCDKEAFLHIDDIAKTELTNSCANRDVTVISAVTMQTPCDTPQEGRSRSNLPYSIIKVDDDQSKSMMDTQTIQKSSGTVDVKESSLAKSSKIDEERDEKEMKNVKKEVEVDEMKDNAEDEDGVVEIEFTRKMSRRISYFDMAEEELKNVMNVSIDNCGKNLINKKKNMELQMVFYRLSWKKWLSKRTLYRSNCHFITESHNYHIGYLTE